MTLLRTLLPLVVIFWLLRAATEQLGNGPISVGEYTNLHWLVTVTAIIFSVGCYQNSRSYETTRYRIWMGVMIAIALIFNPLLPLPWLSQVQWIVIDWVTIIVFAALMLFYAEDA